MSDQALSKRKELAALLKFAAPIGVSQMAAIGMGMTDVIVAGNAGTKDLAGVMIGSNAWQIVAFFFFGIGLANAPIVGRHFGVLDWKSIRDHLHQSVWLALVCGLLTLLFVYLAATYLTLWQLDPEVSLIATGYMLAVLPGAFSMAVLPLFRASLESMNEIHFVMKLSIGVFLLNILLDYWFVFGGFGLEPLGGVGCGWATSIVFCVQLLILCWHLVKSPRLAELKLTKIFPRPRWTLIRPTFLLGLPIGLSTLMEIGFFGGMGLRMADIGVIEAGAHAIAINIAAFVFMLFISLGHAVTVRASHALGRGDHALARQIVSLGLLSVIGFALVSSVATYTLRAYLPGLFNQDADVIRLASMYLALAALFQFFDGLQAVAVCSLRAYKDTAVPCGIQFVAFWLMGLPLGIFLPGTTILGHQIGSEGAWIAFCIALFTSSVILLSRLYMKVFKTSSVDKNVPISNVYE